MLIDVVFAIAHHILIFLLAAIIAAEAVLVRPGLAGKSIGMLGRIDAAYGGIAMAVIIVGIGRVIFGLKGWQFYVTYWAFWAKMSAFVGVALLSILPTTRIAAWRKAAADGDFTPPAEEIGKVRSYILAQAAVFALIPAFAAIMARGIGY